MPSSPAVVLHRRPEDVPVVDDFRSAEVAVPPTGAHELLVEVRDLSLDPYLRSTLAGGHLDDPPVALGDVVPGRSIGRVLESRDPAVPEGSWVLAETGWRSLAVVRSSAATVVEVPAGVPRSAALGALGMPGLTAYAALERHLRPRPGETLAVSSATGGVGAVAGQLARAAGVRVVAIVGNRAKAEDAMGLGYDVAVVRTEADWQAQLAAACPEGVNAYLHMGDGQTLNGVLGRLALGARVSLCGLMAQAGDPAPATLPAGALMRARAEVHGMVVYDHADLATAARATIGELLQGGVMILHEERHDGLDQAPAAFVRLLAGHNRGKVVVSVGGPDDATDYAT